MVCTSPKKQQISRVSRVWLKNYVRHALLKFEIVLAGNPFWVKLGTPNLVESWKLMSTTTGENLVLISQTTFEKFKNNQNLSFPLFLQWYILYLQRYKMYHWRYKENNRFWLILNFSKVVWDIFLKFSPFVYPMFVLIWWKNFCRYSIGLPATAHFYPNFGQL